MGDLVSFGVQKLWELLSQEYEQFEGVEDQVTELKTDLNMLRSFLKDADAKKHSSEMVRNCVEVIKEIIYDAEDIIETFVIKEKFGKSSGVRKRIRRLACIIPERRKIALEFEGISNRIAKVIGDMKSFGVQQIIADGGYILQPLHDRQREMRQTFSTDNESDLVGLEANVKKLVGLMVEEDNVQVVSITGMGGLGKTTLARQVFNHEMVKNKFDGFAWVCVSQEFTRKSVWQTILQNFSPKEDENKILQMTEATLQGELFRMLETSKSLIVLDDIWKEGDWDLIKPIFPPNKGWKVLLTTRNESVAVRGDTTFHKFKPECLNIQDSWTLFQRVTKPTNSTSELKVNEEMENMGKQMIEHCGGLPLAVKVLGGLLAAKYTLHDWKRISENIGSHLVGRTNFSDGNNSSFNYVLSLSYEELPSYLKHCFLYLAHFPEDYVINVYDLSYYWVADGILITGETIQDAGDSCIEELVRRNMVISERDVKTMRFRTCHLHDMMREVCLFKAKEENFLQIAGTLNSQSHGTSRRLVQINPNILDVEREINNPALRSLLVVNGDCWKLSSLSFTRLQLLRVLDLSGAEFERGKLPSDIGKLILLKYLSLQGAKVSHLPSSLQNLKLLIYLNLYVSQEKAIFVPNVLMGMHGLRFLILPNRMLSTTKLELRNLVNLEILVNFSTENSSLEDVHGMARLRNLEIILTAEASSETLSASINGLRDLEALSIEGREFGGMIEKSLFMNFVHLKALSIKGCRLQDEQRFPSNLTFINLTECGLEEDPVPILEKLLHLKHVCLWSQSFCGRRMVCSSGGFPQLQTLQFSNLNEWEEWIVEEGSMPLLRNLYINGCKKLKELPDGLPFIYSLDKLNVHSMGEKWEGRLSEGGEDYYKVQHIPSVNFWGDKEESP